MILDDAFLDRFQQLDASPTGRFIGSPPSKKLSLLLRPAFVARKDRVFVWGDWANIEARVLPWLAASSAAEAVLDVFRTNDADPKLPDIYIVTAAALLNRDPLELWQAFLAKDKEAKAARQAYGKVPTLSLGFGGGLGALLAMATTYGVYLDTETAQRVVNDWRASNPWAKAFWGSHGRNGSYGLWGAINGAIENHDTPHVAGRVAYVYDRSYLGGTLFCALPCGRLLTYPAIKWEWREVENKQTGKLEDRYQLTYLKGYGRKAMWYGIAAENITQAAAASVLRRTLKRLRYGHLINPDRSASAYNDLMPVVMHTHDEVLTEPLECYRSVTEGALQEVMERNDEWDLGLPLKADIKSSWWYTKAID